MRRSFQASRKAWARRLHDTPHRRRAVSPVESTISPSLDDFRERAMTPEKPLLLKHGANSPALSLPAANKWFRRGGDAKTAATWSLSSYMDGFKDWPFPYELVTPTVEHGKSVVAFRDWLLKSRDITDQVLADILQPAISETSAQRRFFQLYAPLSLLSKALEFNHSHSHAVKPLQLYIAQSSLSDLPPALQDDLPAPDVVLGAGKGDVYASSVWLGTEPTYTTLHRDPNPNIFCQLRSHKRVRLLPPALGEQVFFAVQVAVQRQGNSRIRTAEMMEGAEREALHEKVWMGEPLKELREAELGPGDALFIPKGWWHSVKSKGSDGQLNGSVNWWFR